jgi:hypothetical protein
MSHTLSATTDTQMAPYSTSVRRTPWSPSGRRAEAIPAMTQPGTSGQPQILTVYNPAFSQQQATTLSVQTRRSGRFR